MIPAEDLDNLLNLWATVKLRDGSAYRRLWYPSATTEERFARRGGAAPGEASTDPGDPEAFERMDRAMAKLRLKRRGYYAAIHQRWLETGPDESRAKRLGVSITLFHSRLESAKRWLRDELDR